MLTVIDYFIIFIVECNAYFSPEILDSQLSQSALPLQIHGIIF